MHSWLLMAILSGAIQGFWDIFKKTAMEKVSTFNVLSLYTVISFLILSVDYKNALAMDMSFLPIIILKSLLIYFSWIMSFVAIRHLPISVASPLRSLTPLMTIFLGITFLNESLSWLQFAGVGVIFTAYYLIAKGDGRKITDFLKDRFLYLMVASSVLNSMSGMIDKYAMQHINTGQMQFWFMFVLAVLYSITNVVVSHRQYGKMVLSFDKSILLMSIFIVVSDRIYFQAVAMPGSQLSVIMPLRFVSVIVSVVVGGLMFKEHNLKAKLIGVIQLMFGIVLVFVG